MGSLRRPLDRPEQPAEGGLVVGRERAEDLLDAGLVRRQYRVAKSYVDWLAALAMLVAAAPIIGLCALLVRMTSKGPVIYRQERVGLNGRTFTLYKLRTMRVGAEADTGPVWAQGDNDPRIEPAGHMLRRLHLDELPQLFNVLKGDMSLVGPRPERPYFVNQLRHQVPGYERRLAVKPGITGLAQIRAGADHNIRDVRRKVRLDCLYIRRMCWWVDIVIIFGTLRKLAEVPSEGRALGAQAK
jgi:lipopolysaccharide/colanic/teichoic acid biosynthesis glycosyltransferase